MLHVLPSDMSAVYRVAGRSFPLNDAYFQALHRARPLETVAAMPVYAGEALDAHARKRDDVSFLQFLGKFYEAALLLDALRSLGRGQRFRAALDIGSGPALQPRILKLVGCVDRLEAIDIYDGSRRCSDAILRRYARRLRLLYPLYRLQTLVPRLLRQRSSLLRKVDTKLPLGVEGFGYFPDERPYGAWWRRGPTLAAYHFSHKISLGNALGELVPYRLVELDKPQPF